MITTATTTLIFPILTVLLTLFLSTLEIYPAPSSSTLHGATGISQTGAYDHNDPPKSDFLFRLGKLQVYGIRRLFMGVVISTSTLAAVLVTYIALAHRRTVRWDMSERWRIQAPGGKRKKEDRLSGRWCTAADEGLSTSWRASTTQRTGSRVSEDAQTGVVTGRNPSIVVSPVALLSVPTTRPSPRVHLRRRSRDLSVLARPPRSRPQPRVVSSCIGGRIPKTNSQLCRLEEVALEHETAEARRDVSAKAFSDSTSEYEVPSRSFNKEELDDESKGVSRVVECTPAKRTSAEVVPSYYFKEHDEDGRSMLAVVDDDKECASFDMDDPAGLARIPEAAPACQKGIPMETDGVLEGTAFRAPSECARWTPTPPMSEKDGGSRRSVWSGAARTSGVL